MKKKISVGLATILATAIGLSACGTKNYQFDVPSYDEDTAITIGVWNGSHFDLSEEELSTLWEIAESLKKGVPCTQCRYCCAGCPMRLNIPFLLECYNDMKYMASATASVRLDGLDEDKKPACCIQCGQCAHACPQGIDVPAALAELAELYASGPHWAETRKVRSDAIMKDLKKE